MEMKIHCRCGRTSVLADESELKEWKCQSCGEEFVDHDFVYFLCPACDRRLKVDRACVGKKGKCQRCGNIAIVSAIMEPDELKNCPSCGEKIPREAVRCRFCGEFLDARQGARQTLGALSRIWRLLLGSKGNGKTLKYVPVDKIESNPYQPRRRVRKNELEFLRKSIRAFGVVVPIIVRVVPGGYQLVAGQRRFKACKQLGMRLIPAIVRELSVKEMIELSYLENLHRAELTSVEKAEALERLFNESSGVSRERLAEMLGRSPEEAEAERGLLKLPVVLQEAINYGMITDEQARCLATISDMPTIVRLLERVYCNELSLEQTRELVESILLSRKARKSAQGFNSVENEIAPLVPSTEEAGIPGTAHAPQGQMKDWLLC
jgi:ParB family chromosome partitioning protein